MEKIANVTQARKARIAGFDAARGLAIIGMIGAHLGFMDVNTYQLTDGYPSALFAVLAGVSMSIIMAPAIALGGQAAKDARTRMLLRGAIIFAIGIALTAVANGIAVVLTTIAFIFLFLFPITYWRTRTLWVTFVVFWLVGSAAAAFFSATGGGYQYLGGVYPLFAWLAYGTLGVLIHRLLTNSTRLQVAGLVVGGTLAGLWIAVRNGFYFGFDAVLEPLFFSGIYDGTSKYVTSGSSGSGPISAGVMAPGMGFDMTGEQSLGAMFIDNFLAVHSHSGSIIDVLASSLFAIAVISLCLLLCRVRFIAAALYPLRAMGSMALTAYVIHGITAAPIMGMNWFFQAPDFGSSTPVDSASTSSGDSSSGVASSMVTDDPFRMNFQQFQELVKQATDWAAYDQGKADYWSTLSSSSSFGSGFPETLTWGGVVTVGVLLVFCSIWKIFFQRGPMEALVRNIDQRVMNKQLQPRSLVNRPAKQTASAPDEAPQDAAPQDAPVQG